MESFDTFKYARNYNNLPFEIFWKDTEFNYLGANVSFIQSTGLTERDITGKKDGDLPWEHDAKVFIPRKPY